MTKIVFLAVHCVKHGVLLELNKTNHCLVISLYDKHTELKINQRQIFNYTKSNLSENSILLLIDFKENIILGRGSREVNVDFYNREPRIVFGMVAFYKDNSEIKKIHFNVISKVLNHDSLFAQGAIKKVIQNESTFFSQFQSLSLWCDRGPHFCSYEFSNFILKKIQILLPNLKSID